ncbi:MAG: hypothetical protein AAFX93_14565 [Verrucomicrobiota bacterium]
MLRIKLLCTLTVFLAASGLLRAQSATGGTTFLDIISVQQKLGFTISQNYEHAFAADLDNGNGDVAANRFTTVVDYATRWERGFWRAGISFEYTDWQWGGPDLFGDTYELNFNTIFGQRFVDSDWGLVGVLGASLGAERDGGDLGRGGSYRVGVAATYYFGGFNSFSLGVMAIGQEEDDMFLLPLPILNWQITEDINLRTFNGFTISYDISGNKSTEIDFTTEYESDLFRLSTRQPIPGIARAPIVEKQSIVLAGGVTQRLGGGFYIRGYLEGIVWREFKFRHDHSTFYEVTVDPAFAIGLQGGIAF